MGRTTREAHDRITRELNEERAAALRRISNTLESLIVQLREAGDALPPPGTVNRDAAVAAYRELRDRARLYRWYLEVQREAIGLRRHHRLDEFYAMPPDVTGT